MELMATDAAGGCPWDAPNEGDLHHSIRWAALVTAGLCGLLMAHTAEVLRSTGFSNFTASYTMVVASYVFSRFVSAAIFKAPRDAGLQPTLTIVVPAFNESEALARTIASCRTITYPPDKI